MNLTHKLTIGAIALAAIAAIGSGARADVTVASNVSTSSTGGPRGAQQHTDKVIVYYKGDNVRIESQRGVTLFTSGKSYRIDAADQTYSLMHAPPKRPGNAPPNNDTFSLTSSTQTSTIAGQSATQYQLAATGPSGPPPRRPMRGDDGGPGGGGAPGGDDAGGPQAAPASDQAGGPPKASVSGQIWLSDGVKIDSSAKDALMMVVGHELNLRGPLGNPLAAKLAAMGDAPLSATITITMPAMPDGTQPTTTVSVTTTSISTTALDNSLFAIPAGYMLVQGPSGGPGGGRPGAGGPGGPLPPQ